MQVAPALVQAYSSFPLTSQLKSLTVLLQTIPEIEEPETGDMTETSSGETEERVVLKQLVMEINKVSYRVIGSRVGMEDRPDIVDSYFKLLSKVCFCSIFSSIALFLIMVL
jgi:hypothetical protein